MPQHYNPNKPKHIIAKMAKKIKTRCIKCGRETLLKNVIWGICQECKQREIIK